MKTTLVWEWAHKGLASTRMVERDTGEYEAEIGTSIRSSITLPIVGDRRTDLATFGSTALYEISSALHSNVVEPLAISPAHTAGMTRWSMGSHGFASIRQESRMVDDWRD